MITMTAVLDFASQLASADEPAYVVVGDPATWRRNIEQEAATEARLLGEDVPAEVWEVAGLVPRPVSSVPAWDYHAAAARYAVEDAAAVGRGPGMCY